MPKVIQDDISALIKLDFLLKENINTCTYINASTVYSCSVNIPSVSMYEYIPT